MKKRRERGEDVSRKVFIVLMSLVLLLPALLAPFGVDMPDHRVGTQAEEALFSKDPAGWLNDRLALQTWVTSVRARLLLTAGESGSDRVIAGQNSFLFFADTLDDYMGKNIMTDEEISRLCGNILAFSQAFSGRLIVLIAPDKATIYPENMPMWYLKGQGESNLDRVQKALARSGISVLDAKSLLSAGKDVGQLYFSLDTHWNARGARMIALELARMTGNEDFLKAINNIPDEYENGRAGDLLLLCQPGGDPDEPDAAPAFSPIYQAVRPYRTLNDMTIQTTSDASGISLFVLRDSFGERLFPYLAGCAGSMTFSRVLDGAKTKAQSAGAEIVVLEIAERNLRLLLDAELSK